MAAYRRVDDCGLAACTLGSATGPTLSNEYGKPIPFLTYTAHLQSRSPKFAIDIGLCFSHASVEREPVVSDGRGSVELRRWSGATSRRHSETRAQLRCACQSAVVRQVLFVSTFDTVAL